MGTEELIEVLKEEGTITPQSSLEKTVSEGEINGDILMQMCHKGHKLLQVYGFKAGPAFRLEKLYLRLLKEKEKKRSNSFRTQQDPPQKYRDSLNSIKNVQITIQQLANSKTQIWFPYPFLGAARLGTRFQFRENDE